MSYNLESLQGLNLNFSNSGIAAGTTKGTRKHGSLNYAVNGLAVTKAATDNIAAPVAELVKPIPADSTAAFALWIDAAGNYAISQGAIVPGNGKAPSPDDAGNVIVGLVKVATGAGTTFTLGTTGFSDAGITSTFFSAVALPASPI